MLIVVWRPEDATKASLEKMGVHGEEVAGLPIPEDVREQADELGCPGSLASIVNRSSGRVAFVGILDSSWWKPVRSVS